MNIPRTSSFCLDGERALVAGGSSGIGFSCASASSVSALAEAGAHVVIGAQNAVKLYEVASD